MSNKWNDDLRRRMEQYEAPAPDDLFDDIMSALPAEAPAAPAVNYDKNWELALDILRQEGLDSFAVDEAAELLYKEEHKDYQQVVGEGDFPAPLKLCSNIPYVRSILQGTVDMTACRESYARVGALEPETDFFRYQKHVNHDVDNVSSHKVIAQHIQRFGEDYRFETAPNPISALRDRQQDNVDVGRKAVQREPAPVM